MVVVLKFVVAVSAVEVNDPLATFCDAFALLPKATFFTGFSLCNRRFSKIRLARLVRNIVVGSSFRDRRFLSLQTLCRGIWTSNANVNAKFRASNSR